MYSCISNDSRSLNRLLIEYLNLESAIEGQEIKKGYRSDISK